MCFGNEQPIDTGICRGEGGGAPPGGPLWSPASASERIYDLVAIDVDGTLVTSENRLSSDIAPLIREMQARGTGVTLISPALKTLRLRFTKWMMSCRHVLNLLRSLFAANHVIYWISKGSCGCSFCPST